MAVENEETYRSSLAMSKKRSVSEAATVSDPEVLEADPKRRKRVVLGDITHLCNGTAVDVCDAINLQKNKANDVESGNPSCDSDSVSVRLGHMIRDRDTIDINSYIRSKEVLQKNRPSPNYLEVVQKDITASMRAILVDWLVEVSEEYKLSSYTIYLTISYVDRFLSHKRIQRTQLQLLGIACMLVASKYEEISSPNIEDFCYITDNTYRQQELVEMELEVLKFLKWELGVPTVKTFLWRYINSCQDQSDGQSSHVEFLSSYLAELSLLEYNCVQFLPSVIAASAVFLARLTINPIFNPWTPALYRCSKYKPSDLQDCIKQMFGLQHNRRMVSLTAIREKYKHNRFKGVASMIPPSEIPSRYFQDST
ncbi:Cyclin A-like protein [Zostera marina]|uniref:Cyclin A-like protein n=1 Tax=Zostera marina TaxID=29655 RepID=A0A0K9Q0D7_ZOSMR|nr:Cyclin A-like protein [Zostera marina]